MTIKRIEQTIADQPGGSTASWKPQPAAVSTGRTSRWVPGLRDWRGPTTHPRRGHHVTVYERGDQLGGLLRYGIPEYKLEKATLNQRLPRCVPRAPGSSQI